MKKIILEEQGLDEKPWEALLENDELSPEEEAFMRGYEEAG